MDDLWRGRSRILPLRPLGHLLDAALDAAVACKGVPTVILADTVKGKGWKRIEGTTMSHSLSVSADDLAEALNDIDKE